MSEELVSLYDGSDEVLAAIRNRTPQAPPRAVGEIVRTYHPKRLELTVAAVLPQSPTAVTLRLHRDHGDLPPFLAGQYVNVFYDATSRPYAMSSAPGADHYDLTIKRVAGGRVSNALIDRVRVGDVLTTTGPMGTFHHNPLFHGDDLVFLAGGSGVVPAMSMIRDILGENLQRRLHLIYGVTERSDVIFAQELAAITDQRIRVDVVVGRLLTAEVIRELTGPLQDRMVYICGPQAMYPFAVEQLRDLGHPRRRTRFEANGAPSDPTSQASWPSGLDPQTPVTVTARGRSFSSPAGRPLLDALEDQGFALEVACRSGECSLCRVRVVSGIVHNADEARLRLSDRSAGYVHSCVAYPVTDVTLDW